MEPHVVEEGRGTPRSRARRAKASQSLGRFSCRGVGEKKRRSTSLLSVRRRLPPTKLFYTNSMRMALGKKALFARTGSGASAAGLADLAGRTAERAGAETVEAAFLKVPKYCARKKRRRIALRTESGSTSSQGDPRPSPRPRPQALALHPAAPRPAQRALHGHDPIRSPAHLPHLRSPTVSAAAPARAQTVPATGQRVGCSRARSERPGMCSRCAPWR